MPLEPPDQPGRLDVKEAKREVVPRRRAERTPRMQVQVGDGGARGDMVDQLHRLRGKAVGGRRGRGWVMTPEWVMGC